MSKSGVYEGHLALLLAILGRPVKKEERIGSLIHLVDDPDVREYPDPDQALGFVFDWKEFEGQRETCLMDFNGPKKDTKQHNECFEQLSMAL